MPNYSLEKPSRSWKQSQQFMKKDFSYLCSLISQYWSLGIILKCINFVESVYISTTYGNIRAERNSVLKYWNGILKENNIRSDQLVLGV